MKPRIAVSAAVLSAIVLASPAATWAASATTDFSGVATSVLWARIQRFFVTSEAAKSQFTLKIANAHLMDAQSAAIDKQGAQAAADLALFTKEQARLATEGSDLVRKSASDPDAAAQVDRLLTDQIQQRKTLEEIEATGVSAATDPAGKAFTNVAAVLSSSSLSQIQQSRALVEVEDKAASQQIKAEDKVAAKIELEDELDSATPSTSLKAAIGQQEDINVAEAAALTPARISNLVTSLASIQQTKQVAVLQQLLAQAPDAAKPGITTALNAVSKQLATVGDTQQALDAIATDTGLTDQERQDILGRIKEQASSEAQKQQVEAAKKVSEQTTQAQEDQLQAQEEQAKKKAEQEKESQQKKAEASKTPEVKTAEPSHTPEPSETPEQHVSSSSPSATSSPSQTSVTLKMESGRFDKSVYQIDAGKSVTVQFENDDSVPYTLTLSNGLTSGAVSGGAQARLSAFTLTSAVTASVTVNGQTVTTTISPQS